MLEDAWHMSEVILGIDLGTDTTRLGLYRPENMEPMDVCFPQAEGQSAVSTAVCKRNSDGKWLIGREAYETALNGEGIIFDSLLRKPETEPLAGFLDCLFACAGCGEEEGRPAGIVVAAERFEPEVLETVMEALGQLGIPKEKVRLISRGEAFLHYVLAQPKDMWANTSVLFDWTGEELHFYELNVVRGVRPNQVRVRERLLEEGFSDELLSSEAGRKLADSRLNNYAAKLLEHHSVSSCFLTGKGLSDCSSWAKNFLRTVGYRNKVYREDSLFARGAAFAVGNGQTPSASSLVFLCEGRLKASAVLECTNKGARRQVVLAGEGEPWFGKVRTLRIIPENKEFFDLRICRSGERLFRCERISLAGFPDRPRRTTCLELKISCLSEKEARIELRDLGFGEIFPAGSHRVERVIRID